MKIHIVKLMVGLAALALLAGGCKKDKGTSCPPGEVGCACIDGTVCAGALTCVDSTCRGEREVWLGVSDKKARSCEALIVENGTTIFGAVSSADARATSVREKPKTAVTFIALEDSAFGKKDVGLRVADDDTDIDEVLSIKSSSCADEEGKTLDGAEVTLP
jgi:hypothetical protein